ncbi:MAG: hypothetical protein M3453_13580 [Pseudomonadota bacterium]|nr:hypothetical protein [Pseudomonadota bacterium]
MTDRRWKYVFSDAGYAAKHFTRAIEVYSRPAPASDEEDYISSMGFMHMMQSGHTSAEAALRRVLGIVNEELPIGPDTHARLIDQCAEPIYGTRPAMVSSELRDALRETRRFRHVAMHGYDLLDRGKARHAVEAAKVVASRLEPEIAAFRDAIDPPG